MDVGRQGHFLLASGAGSVCRARRASPVSEAGSLGCVEWSRLKNSSSARTGITRRRPILRLASSLCAMSVATVLGETPSRRAPSEMLTAITFSSLPSIAIIRRLPQPGTSYRMAHVDTDWHELFDGQAWTQTGKYAAALHVGG
jgi:hypothetical protein